MPQPFVRAGFDAGGGALGDKQDPAVDPDVERVAHLDAGLGHRSFRQRNLELARNLGHASSLANVKDHVKDTEIADRLYGVTMEEPGVSTLISIQLN